VEDLEKKAEARKKAQEAKQYWENEQKIAAEKMKAEKEAQEEAERVQKAKAEAEEAKRRQDQEDSEVISKKAKYDDLSQIENLIIEIKSNKDDLEIARPDLDDETIQEMEDAIRDQENLLLKLKTQLLV